MLATKVKDLTGPGLTDRFRVGGTDLGATTTAPDGRLVSVFGDTFAQAGVGGRGWPGRFGTVHRLRCHEVAPITPSTR